MSFQKPKKHAHVGFFRSRHCCFRLQYLQGDAWTLARSGACLNSVGTAERSCWRNLLRLGETAWYGKTVSICRPLPLSIPSLHHVIFTEPTYSTTLQLISRNRSTTICPIASSSTKCFARRGAFLLMWDSKRD